MREGLRTYAMAISKRWVETYNMNISFVLSYIAERFGGPVIMAKSIGTQITKIGHNVSYWSTGDEVDKEELSAIEGASVYDLDWPQSWRRSKSFVSGLSSRVDSIDIMHINGFWLHPIYAASRISHAHNTPYILRPAGGLEPWGLKSTRLKWLKKKAYLNLIGKTMMRNATCLHAITSREAEHFRQLGYRGQIIVVPNGIDIDRFTTGDGREAEKYWPNLRNRPVVLFMSRLSPEKGLDILIPLWADIVKQQTYKDAILVLAGPDDRGYSQTVEAMIKSYNLGENFLMTGMIKGQKKLSLMQRADVFILPSYSENFGIVVIEALACGTPVITTTSTPWEKLHKINAGRWVTPEKQELSQAVKELLDMSQAERQDMGSRGRKFVLENYKWDQIAEQLVMVYDSILHGKDIPFQSV